jgi:hypothetical protein
MSKSKEYNIHRRMKQRCFNSNSEYYYCYGGRGITVCARWRNSFENFYADMGPCPDGYSIDRINNNGNYTPSNCQWADGYTQANNTRNNKVLTHKGVSLTAAQWSRKVGIGRRTLTARLNRLGWSTEKALTTPVKKRKTSCQ